ncbi:MAG: threonylcarbamoyl-AMP synthase [Gammaproteobacteria bacterium]|nr:threonylcarbamoyl-AMP synthase [Gammaproteobacteria bacterium]
MPAQFIPIHPDNPQPRLVAQVVTVLRKGGVVAYPTDSSYALGCHIGDKTAMDAIRRLRGLEDKHNFTLVCRDLSEIATYARISNTAYRMIKSVTPGAYTFILRATREVPRRLQHPRRRTIGIRVPDNAICKALLDAMGEPLMSVSLMLPGEELPLSDAEEIREKMANGIDVIVDGGACGYEPTTVVEWLDDEPVLVREGRGNIAALNLD